MGYFNDGNIEVFNKAWLNVFHLYQKTEIKQLLLLEDDRSSPKYYLFDLDNREDDFFFNMWPEIEETNLAKTKPIKFTK